MTDHAVSQPADRPWPIVVLAGATWLPACLLPLLKHTPPDGQLIAAWGALLGLTLLPLALTRAAAFRRACLVIGAVGLAVEFILSLPFFLIALPFFVALCPAGALLLLAGWKKPGPARTTIAAVLGGLSLLVSAALLRGSV
jgi:hypothetical protein